MARTSALSATQGNTLAVPTNLITTSFPPKSELSLNLSTKGTALTFMGYDASVNSLDISNSTTPDAPDSKNPDTASLTYREVAQGHDNGNVQISTTNAYSGNNGRAAILDNSNNDYLTVNNAGNGGTPTGNVAAGARVQVVAVGQNPVAPV